MLCMCEVVGNDSVEMDVIHQILETNTLFFVCGDSTSDMLSPNWDHGFDRVELLLDVGPRR